MAVRTWFHLFLLCSVWGFSWSAPAAVASDADQADGMNTVRLKDLGRFAGWRENVVIGYGIVTGLAGSGDSPRSAVTRQTLSNVLGRMGLSVLPEQIQSRNVAAVMVTATLNPAVSVGDRIDVSVSSIGDARSLVGGTLLMTPLYGPDQRSYALAQGALVVGGYSFQDNVNLRQRNFPTAGTLPGGATVEAALTSDLQDSEGRMRYILRNPDFTTAARIAQALRARLGDQAVTLVNAQTISVDARALQNNPGEAIALLENIAVIPDQMARIVINERTGTIVSGGGVAVSDTVIAQGDIRVSVTRESYAALPDISGGIVVAPNGLIVTNRRLAVETPDKDVVLSTGATTIADVAQALSDIKVDTRTMIAIFQAMRTAGAIHADVVVQ